LLFQRRNGCKNLTSATLLIKHVYKTSEEKSEDKVPRVDEIDPVVSRYSKKYNKSNLFIDALHG
jgi:hypothetical protein